jgi:hypothetical protein
MAASGTFAWALLTQERAYGFSATTDARGRAVCAHRG